MSGVTACLFKRSRLFSARAATTAAAPASMRLSRLLLLLQCTTLTALLQAGGALFGLKAGGTGGRRPAACVVPQMNMNMGERFMRSMSQLSDQRVARVSTILVPFDTEKTLDEAYACFEAWKEEIGDDPVKFAEVARRESEDPTSASNGGDIGFVTRARQLPPQLDDVVFRDQKPGEERPGVCKSLSADTLAHTRAPSDLASHLSICLRLRCTDGPIGTTNGLELIYLHSCGEPKSED